MKELDKIIKGFECCKSILRRSAEFASEANVCEECPYNTIGSNAIDCIADLHDDALKVLKQYKVLVI